MFKALWFIIKISLALGAALWLLEQPGEAVFTISSYEVRTSFGVAIIGICLISYLILSLNRILDWVKQLPHMLRINQKLGAYNKSLAALSRSLNALSAGDYKTAQRQNSRAKKLLGKEDNSLILILEALTAKNAGNHNHAKDNYLKLMNDKNTALIGAQGLIQASTKQGNIEEALMHARKAHDLHPKHKNILKNLFFLEIKSEHWEKALSLLGPAQKAGVFPAKKTKSHKAAILTHRAENALLQDKKALLKNALKYDAGFTPAVTLFLDQELDKKIFEAAWKIQPHPDLVPYWDQLMSDKTRKKASNRLKWAEKLIHMAPGNILGYLFAAQTALDLNLYGQARTHLEAALTIEKTKQVYGLFAALEETEFGQEEAQKWHELAFTAPVGKQWVCVETGRIYDSWALIAQPHGSFNTIKWIYAYEAILSATQSNSFIAEESLILEAREKTTEAA